MKLRDFMQTGRARYDAALSRLITCPRVELSHLGSGEFPVMRARVNRGATRPVFVVGGIHGDEVAGVTGILDLVCSQRFPDDLSVDFFPVLNPVGFMDGTRRKRGVDMNRDACRERMQSESGALLRAMREEYPSMVATMHEDGSQSGFYMYYSDEQLKPLWDKMARVASDFFPICSGDVHGDQCLNGLIRHPSEERIRSEPKHLCSLENAAMDMGIHYVTTETPTDGHGLARRTVANRRLLQTLLDSLPR